MITSPCQHQRADHRATLPAGDVGLPEITNVRCTFRVILGHHPEGQLLMMLWVALYTALWQSYSLNQSPLTGHAMKWTSHIHTTGNPYRWSCTANSRLEIAIRCTGNYLKLNTRNPYRSIQEILQRKALMEPYRDTFVMQIDKTKIIGRTLMGT